VGDEGLEPPTVFPSETVVGLQGGALSGALAPDLAVVVEAWPRLSLADRRRILSVVRMPKAKSPPRPPRTLKNAAKTRIATPKSSMPKGGQKPRLAVPKPPATRWRPGWSARPARRRSATEMTCQLTDRPPPPPPRWPASWPTP